MLSKQVSVNEPTLPRQKRPHQGLRATLMVTTFRPMSKNVNANTLRTQLLIFSGICKTNQLDTGYLLSDIINLFKTLLKPQISPISQVACLLKLIIVMPATNAVSERPFSAMRRLKIYLRTNMGMDRPNNIMVLYVYKPRTDCLDMI